MSSLRFISKYAGYTIGFQTEFVQYMQDGQGRTVSNVLRPMLDCKFSNRVSLTPWEMEEAKKRFEFRGTVLEADEVTVVSPLSRISVFDTDVFARDNMLDAETKQRLEEHLLMRPEYGVDYVMVTEPRIPAPWPAYDSIRGGGAKSTAQKVVEQVVELGFADDPQKLEQVIAYERQNLNRAEVVLALEEHLKAPEGEAEEELIGA